jgi:putative methyltransferase (TIGR04325 family)
VYFEISRLVGESVDWWNIVELPDVAAHGNQRFADEKLRFFDSIDAATARGKPNIVILFHVLQYLEAPFEYLSQLIALEPQIVVLHEFPLAERERFMVQDLLPELGGGSRPIRIFAQKDMDVAFVNYELVDELTLPQWDRALSNARMVARVYRRRSRSDTVSRSLPAASARNQHFEQS